MDHREVCAARLKRQSRLLLQRGHLISSLGKREGVCVWDTHGDRRLIDCHCNGGVFNLGHRNPRVVAALQRALHELDIGNHHFISEHRALLGEAPHRAVPG